jgi:carbamate kinase
MPSAIEVRKVPIHSVADASELTKLIDDGVLAADRVVANGGGGIPVVRTEDGSLSGVEAVIDKDLGAALLARTVAADVLIIATDVPNAVLHFGTPEAESVGRVTVTQMRAYSAEGHFASGSMGPKVDAACRFVERGGQRAVITNLDTIVDAVTGESGTVVVPD